MKKILLMGLIFTSMPVMAEKGANTLQSDYQLSQSNYTYTSQQPIPLTYSMYADYLRIEGNFANNIKEDLDGLSIGVSSLPNRSGWWGKAEYLRNSDYDAQYFEFAFGLQVNLFDATNAYILSTLGLGFSMADVGSFDDTSFITLPIGLEGGFHLAPYLSIYAGVGYKWAWDTSSNTTCRDGTQTNNTGKGSCSWHGGISHYNETIGDFDGVIYKTGLRYNF